MSTRLTEHFALEEFLPPGMDAGHVPADVAENLRLLAAAILEPVRERFGVPLHIHSGWRPAAYNAAHGGVRASDHTTGRAADFHVADTPTAPWEVNTGEAFHFICSSLAGAFGQVILEDHRIHLGLPGKLWVHAAIPSEKHPGDGSDTNAILYSYAPGKYRLEPRE